MLAPMIWLSAVAAAALVHLVEPLQEGLGVTDRPTCLERLRDGLISCGICEGFGFGGVWDAVVVVVGATRQLRSDQTCLGLEVHTVRHRLAPVPGSQVTKYITWNESYPTPELDVRNFSGADVARECAPTDLEEVSALRRRHRTIDGAGAGRDRRCPSEVAGRFR